MGHESSIKAEAIGNVVIFRVVGKLHADNATKLHALCEEKLSLPDSFGIGEVARCYGKVELLYTTLLFEMFDSEEQALRSFGLD